MDAEREEGREKQKKKNNVGNVLHPCWPTKKGKRRGYHHFKKIFIKMSIYWSIYIKKCFQSYYLFMSDRSVWHIWEVGVLGVLQQPLEHSVIWKRFQITGSWTHNWEGLFFLTVPKTKESLKHDGYIMLWGWFAGSGDVSLVCVHTIIKPKKTPTTTMWTFWSIILINLPSLSQSYWESVAGA